MKDGHLWKAISAIELLIAVVVIYLDLLIPTLVMLGVIAVSLLIRKDKLSSLGFKKVENPGKMVLIVLVLVVVWTLFHMSVSMPIMNHLTGTTQDLSAFEDLQGDLVSLMFFLLATWTLAAFGEEIVYRGFLQQRARDLFRDERLGVIAAVAFSSLLFGMAHSEQGVIGVVLTTMDAVFFSAIKLRFNDNLWAAILAHGTSNTIGLVVFFIVGPVYGFW